MHRGKLRQCLSGWKNLDTYRHLLSSRLLGKRYDRLVLH